MFTAGLDEELLLSFGVQALKTPPRTPKANAYCERVIGTIRRECLAFAKRHFLPHGHRLTAKPILGGLHHEYGSEKEAA